ncbi:MAG: hypothetical protein WDW36_007855 [Sanguina aurantia]
MEGTPEGLAAAAATREAASQRKRQAESLAAATAASNPTSQADLDSRKKAAPARPAPTVSHEVAVPEGYDELGNKGLDPELHGTLQAPIFKGKRAKEYKFVLDPFQETSVACLERRESVLVSAHTSAGKTVVAEYAIAMAFRDKQRVIYTSPIKALSNQKFRELSEEFGDVGLMTGDVSLNPNAACIVMTTEILRSMIYRGSELLREVAWVIFDEIHYMQDRERGVVWEETIIFLEDDCKMVFLSATLSNASEFAAWVAHLHKQPTHVVYTDYRPTPLQHYAYPSQGAGMYLIKDEKGNFRPENFERLRSTFKVAAPPGEITNGSEGSAGRDGGRGGRGRGGRGGRDGGRGGRGAPGKGMAGEVQSILKVIQLQKWEPVIFFTFVRKECETFATGLNAFDFNTDEEKANVDAIYENAIKCLGEADRTLPAIERMLPILRRGIGVHHSGLLPILKELIEILFQEGLLKVLFATETFAMGLNMPARSVVFTALKKWDGENNRWMLSGEYIQMSGRAGRRGMDDRGICIMMIDQEMDEATCKEMVQGKPSPLLSSFKLTYYTMLNMLRRVESTHQTMEFVIKNSFQQFQQDRSMPLIAAQLAMVEAQAAEAGREGEESLSQYAALRAQLNEAAAALQAICLRPQHCLPFLQAGRIVRVANDGVDWGYGVLVSVIRQQAVSVEDVATYLVDVLLAVDLKSLSGASAQPLPAKMDSPDAVMEVVPAMLSTLTAISTLRVTIPADLRPSDNRRTVLLQLQELCRRYPDGLAELDPIEDMGIHDPDLEPVVTRIEQLETQLASNPVFQSERDDVRFAAWMRRAQLQEEADALRAKLKESHLSAFRREAKNRTAVLRRLGHVSEEGVVTLKGRAACEIDTADELLVVELMLNGTFSSLDKHQLVALVSCLVPTEKSAEVIKIATSMGGALSQLQETARHIAEVSRECKLEVDVDAYLDGFKPSLMDVIYAWSKGASFAEICRMTDIFEGSIIRATRRLDELMQQLAAAAHAVGDEDLKAKIVESNLTIRRDIMFAASLYV